MRTSACVRESITENHFRINSRIFPKTADKFFEISSFLIRTIRSPISFKSFVPRGIIFFLFIMDTAIQFNNQPRLVAEKVNDESCDNLLPPEMGSQLVSAKFVP